MKKSISEKQVQNIRTLLNTMSALTGKTFPELAAEAKIGQTTIYAARNGEPLALETLEALGNLLSSSNLKVDAACILGLTSEIAHVKKACSNQVCAGLIHYVWAK